MTFSYSLLSATGTQPEQLQWIAFCPCRPQNVRILLTSAFWMTFSYSLLSATGTKSTGGTP